MRIMGLITCNKKIGDQEFCVACAGEVLLQAGMSRETGKGLRDRTAAAAILQHYPDSIRRRMYLPIRKGGF
jgi:RNase H-fold protein (predicted Holliday junction resolvase)